MGRPTSRVSRPSSASQGATQSKRSEVKAEAKDNGYNGEEMGMTQERQREIQASLFKMLGQPDTPEGSKTEESKMASSESSSSL